MYRGSDQAIPKEKNAKRQNSCLRRPYNSCERREAKGRGEKERYTRLKADFQSIARRDKKAFFNDQCKEIEESHRMGKLEISSRKLEIPRKYFTQRWAHKG